MKDRTLKEYITELNTREIALSSELDRIKYRLFLAREAKEPTVSQVYADIVGDSHQYCTSILEVKEYEYILGGDGRSAPWSETRSGPVLTIKFLPDVYLNMNALNNIKLLMKTDNPALENITLIYDL